MFLGVLQGVADKIDRPLSTEARASLESALRYFHEAAPKHTADEEESLFPRLRQMDDPELQGAISALDALEHDQVRAGALHDAVHTSGVQCLERGHLPAGEAAQFRRAVGELAAIYREHIRIEDNIVFPAAQRALAASHKAAIAREMALRRALPSPS